MDRRSFLLNATAYTLPIPSGNEIHFRIYRNGSAVGDHYVRFKQSGDDLTISIAITGQVGFAGIPIFSYSVNATEIWRDGVFHQLDSAVNYNGQALEVQARQIADGYTVQGTHMPLYTAPPNLMPLTYWNKAMLNGTILNIQTAHSYPAIVSSPGWNALPTANAGTLTARRFDVTGKLHLSVWYDQNNAWSGLAFQRDGDFNYEKYV